MGYYSRDDFAKMNNVKIKDTGATILTEEWDIFNKYKNIVKKEYNVKLPIQFREYYLDDKTVDYKEIYWPNGKLRFKYPFHPKTQKLHGTLIAYDPWKVDELGVQVIFHKEEYINGKFKTPYYFVKPPKQDHTDYISGLNGGGLLQSLKAKMVASGVSLNSKVSFGEDESYRHFIGATGIMVKAKRYPLNDPGVRHISRDEEKIGEYKFGCKVSATEEIGMMAVFNGHFRDIGEVEIEKQINRCVDRRKGYYAKKNKNIKDNIEDDGPDGCIDERDGVCIDDMVRAGVSGLIGHKYLDITGWDELPRNFPGLGKESSHKN